MTEALYSSYIFSTPVCIVVACEFLLEIVWDLLFYYFVLMQ